LPLEKSAHGLYPRSTAVRTEAHGGVERIFLVWRLISNVRNGGAHGAVQRRTINGGWES
jgi:hypothetical protein